MKQTTINTARLNMSLIVSGMTFCLAYLLFLIIWGFRFDGWKIIASVFEIFTLQTKAHRFHVFVILVSFLTMPFFVLLYGRLTYIFLIKRKWYCFPNILLCSIAPAVFLGALVFRDVYIFAIVLYFCIWHSSVAWWLVNRTPVESAAQNNLI